MSAILQRFREKLPHKPYCTNDFVYGVRILPKNITVLARFTQQSQPHILYWLPFDVDRMEASIDRNNRDYPAPNITVKNPRNGHVYLLYALTLPVGTASDASASTLRYAAAIEHALCGRLGADVDYNGLICKNPCYPERQEVEWREEPYALGEPVGYLDLSTSAHHSVDKNYGLERNCHLFEEVRKQACRAIRQGWPVFSQWLDAVIQRVEVYNTSPSVLLSPAECRAIDESITKRIHRRLSPEGFSIIQIARGRRGRTKSKRAAVSTLARSLKPWEVLGISRTTCYRKLKYDPDLAK